VTRGPLQPSEAQPAADPNAVDPIASALGADRPTWSEQSASTTVGAADHAPAAAMAPPAAAEAQPAAAEAPPAAAEPTPAAARAFDASAGPSDPTDRD
jgi:hypothetical protein